MPKKKADGVDVFTNYDELVRIEKLSPHPDNPNEHPEEQLDLLAKIIQRNGWRDRIVVSKRSGLMIKGHGRYQAALRLGVATVPVEYQDYETETDEIKDLVADNKIAELSKVNDEMAFEVIDKLGIEDFDMQLAGFQFEDFEGDWGKEDDKKKSGEGVEIKFSEELTESSNYIVLIFDNDIDWAQAKSLFDLKSVKSLKSKKGFEQIRIGRVLKGSEAIERIKGR